MTTFKGKPCINCNNTERYESNRGCVTCVRAAAAKRIEKNRAAHYAHKINHYHNSPGAKAAQKARCKDYYYLNKHNDNV